MARVCRPVLLLAAAFLFLVANAQAATIYLKARLEVVPSAVAFPLTGVSNGDGAALFSYDTSSNLLSWTVTYRNLTGPLTAAHLHGPAAPGQDAPIVVPMTVSPSPLTGSAVLTAGQASDMLAGLWYVNLHTNVYPDGELRGQLAQIDTDVYSVSYGAPAQSNSYISGTVAMDMATLQMSWNISWDVILLHYVSATDFHGPAKGPENAPVTVSAPTTVPSTGSVTLTAAQAAELVNGFWYFQVNDINGPFRAYVLPVYPHLSNISTRLEVRTGEGVGIAGFVIGGSSPKTVVIVGKGPSLANYGIANPIADPKLTLVRQSDQEVIAENDDWQVDNPNSFYLAGWNTDSRESALLLTLAPGAYTAILSNADRGDGVGLVAVYERNNPQAPFVNISTRGTVLQGEGVMIGGFIIEGVEPKTVVVRASGPSLAAYGVSAVLANPTVTLVRSSDGAIIAANDDWQSASNAAELRANGFAPGDPAESAILITLAPGAYTAIVAGQGGGTGIGTVEVFTVD